MTKTRANEPGFVLVPREPTDAMLRAGWELADFNPLRDGYVGQVYRAMLASAPLVPSPAYGGAKEALDPFAKLADAYFFRYETTPGSYREAHADDPDDRSVFGINMFTITAGDLRRARTAYDALSPVAVEEADANLTPCERCQGNGEIVTDWDRYLHSHNGDVGDEAVAECPDCSGQGEVGEADAKAAEPLGYLKPESDHTLEPRFIYAKDRTEEWMLGVFTVPVYSTPSPQIGKAGAGPAGEAVAWFFEREGDPTSPRVSFSERLTDAAKRAGWTESPLYARTVEEPGEVERTAASYHESWLHEADRADTAEAALTETRERLEKVEATLREIGSNEVPIGLVRKRARAALTGDAQEGGK